MARWRAALNLDKWDAENTSELVYPVLLLTEGKSDASFLTKLCDQREVGGVHFGFPTRAHGFGQPGFPRYLSDLPIRTGFQSLCAVVMVYDNDSDPMAAFQTVNGFADPEIYSLPAKPMSLSDDQSGKVRLMLSPMPGIDQPGALETLLIQAVTTTAADELRCIDTLGDCVGSADWPPAHMAKMRLRCLIAAKCPGESDTSLTYIWSKPGNPIDLDHSCFDGLVDCVRGVRDAA